MEQRLPLLLSHLCVGIAEHKPNGGEKVTFSRSIATNDDIMFGREWLNYSLFLVAERRSAWPIEGTKLYHTF